ncbi:MAG: hypothetical protein U0U66_10450 [Cytophagaceae bacterium]
MTDRIQTLAGEFSKSKYYNIIIATAFGILAAVFGHIYFAVLDYGTAYTDLREIPIIIGVFYLRNPLYSIIIVLLSAVHLVSDLPYWPTVVMHIAPAFFAYYAFHCALEKIHTSWVMAVFWIAVVLVYYYIIIIPMFVLTYEWFGLNTNPSFLLNYKNLAVATKYEVATTLLVTALYAVQLLISYRLKHINDFLEKSVKDRTTELDRANNQLKRLNNNLELIVKERTERVNEQLHKFQKYTHMNSHDLRAPLARIMGLTLLLKKNMIRLFKLK